MQAEWEIVKKVTCRDGEVYYLKEEDSAEEAFGEDVLSVERFVLVKEEQMVALGMMS